MKRLALIHQINTDSAFYRVYHVETDEKHPVPIEIDQHMNTEIGAVVAHEILADKLFEESWGLMGGQSFNSFVIDCLRILHEAIIANGETIIKDEPCNRKLIGGIVFED